MLIPLPSDVDLMDLPFMQLHDKRLLGSRSWLRAKNWRGEGPGLAFCLVNLWVEAFRSVPAGSLEDDDDVLADKARCDIDAWRSMKDLALCGWERHNGRLWHSVICEIAWELWLVRLEARHRNALDSHRAAAKRAMDKGNLPPDPPGGLEEWIAAKYPATYTLRAAMKAAESAAAAATRPTDKMASPYDIRPKRSQGNAIPPLPPYADVDGKGSGPDNRKAADRRGWFAQEKRRLENEFGSMVPIMLTNLQRPNVTGDFGFVRTFKNCWIERDANGLTQIITPSKRQADAILAAHGEWLRHYWPELVVRHAKVDELRARKPVLHITI